MVKQQLISDGIWVATAQVASAIGALVTVRVLTELVTPETFGVLALALGVVTFGQALLCTPILQAFLRYYPDVSARDGVATLCAIVKAIIVRRGSYLAAAGIMISMPAYLFWNVSLGTVILAGLCILIEIRRSYSVTLFNPIRRQKPFAAVMVLDAALRPTLAWLLVPLTSFEVEAVLVAFIAASAIGVAISEMWGLNEDAFKESPVDREVISKYIQNFSLPLLPLAFVGWLNGTLDRYVIAGMLGTAQAGLYSAAYGLVSRPFLMVGHILEQTLRPIYYEVGSSDKNLAKRYFNLWLSLALFAGVLGFLFILIFSNSIAEIFLGKSFSEAASIMPWIAAAYATVAVVQVLEKRLYLACQTRLVLVLEGAGFVAIVVSLPIFLKFFGLVGGALSLFIGAIVQIGIALCLVFGSRPNLHYQGVLNAHEIKSEFPSVRSA